MDTEEVMPKLFKDEAVRPVWRRWMCGDGECKGEMKSSDGITTTFGTDWRHYCDECHRQDWADTTYPRIAHLDHDNPLERG